MGKVPDTRLLVAALVLGTSAYATAGDALDSYSPGPLALLQNLAAPVTFAVYAAFTGLSPPEVNGAWRW